MNPIGRKTIAVIPLRSGSKGLPGKNVRKLAGKPLFAHSLDHARSAGVDEIIISTDIAELIEADFGPDVRIDVRPSHLGQDQTKMDDVLHHLISSSVSGPATIVLLQATSPLRDPADISRAVKLLEASAYDLVMSVTPASSSVLKWGTVDGDKFLPLSEPEHCFSNRLDLPSVYRPDGAIYAFDAGWLIVNRGLACDNIGVIVTPACRAFDIDTLEDFKKVEALLSSGGFE